jgi:predicted nuclease of predicted toxin-antitoxin system
VLFDEDVPRQLRRDLSEFAIRTVQEQGWSSVKNGELLRTASREFDVLLTADKNLQYQQSIPKFNIGVVVLAARDTRLPSLRSILPQIQYAIATVEPGTVIIVPSSQVE